MLGAADIPILHLFVDALKKESEITQSKTIGPGKEGEITCTGMWIAAMSGGGFGIHQCPYVTDVLKSWRMSDCRQSATLGSHDSWTQLSAVEVPGKNTIAIRRSFGPKVCWCHDVVVHEVQT